MIPEIRCLIVDSINSAYLIPSTKAEEQFFANPAICKIFAEQIIDEHPQVRHVQIATEDIFSFLFYNDQITLLKYS